MKPILSAVLAASVILGSTGHAADEKPAVSEANYLAVASVASAGSTGDGNAALLGGGQYTTPLGEDWGARANLSVGLAFGSGTDAAEAVDGSLSAFWRRPDTGYAEVRGFGSHFGSVDIYGVNGTGGRYLDDWEYDLGVGYLNTPEGDAASIRGGVGHYPNDELRLRFGVSAGSSFGGEASYLGELSALWQPTLDRNFVFGVDVGGGAIGNVGFYLARLSAILYFGEARTLRRKIREDW